MKYVIHFMFSSVALLIMFSCANKVDNKQDEDLMTFLTKEIQKNDILSKDVNKMYLFITDNMCVECINKEYINIHSDSIPVSIVGIFNDKRNFLASTNTLNFCSKVFIKNTNNYFIKLPTQPFYFLYNVSTNIISDVFYPQACKEELTIQYFDKVRTKLAKLQKSENIKNRKNNK